MVGTTGAALGSAHEVAVAGVAGVGHQHFVARVDQRQAGQVQRGRGASRDHDAPCRNVHPEAAFGYQPLSVRAARAGPGGVGVLGGTVADGRWRASCTSGGAVKSGSPMFRKIMGSLVPATSRAMACGWPLP